MLLSLQTITKNQKLYRRQNYFNKFEKTLKRISAEFGNQQSKDNLDRIKNEINDVHQIMSENVNLLVDTENIMGSVSAMS